MTLMVTHKIRKFRTSGRKGSLKFRLIVIGCLFVCYIVIGGLKKPEDEDFVFGSGRKLLFVDDLTPNCTPPAIDEFPNDLFTKEQRQSGAIILHGFLACYLFILLAFVCDDYFVPSIETLCETLGMSEDVAGATFMAAATSSPELFINIVGTFVTKGDIGVGTIVGSAVFNILAVPACCGLFAGQVVHIDWWPLTRDCIAYGTTVVLLIFCLQDGHVDWYEALVLVSLYILYIVGMYFNERMSRFVKRCCTKRKKYKEILEPRSLLKETSPLLVEQNNNTIYSNNDTKLNIGESTTPHSSLSTSSDTTLTDSEALVTLPSGFWSKCFFVLHWPISFVLFLTIPDCRKEDQRKLWPVTFIMCIAWIASTSYIVSWMITIIGDTIAIPDSVMGLTFLAAGMSVPEATSSVIVTNQGHGGMGISSSIGSNTFDILLCLGLPWLVKSAFFPTQPGVHVVEINSEGLEYSTMSLLSTLFLLYGSFALNGFKVDRKIGIVCLLMYISFLIFASLMELNFFFPVNLPTCVS